MIDITNNNIVDITVGSTPNEKVYLGSQLVWEKAEEGFVECNYIENTSTAYIDTGLIHTTAQKVECEFSFTENTAATNQVLFGSRNYPSTTNSNARAFAVWLLSDGTFRNNYMNKAHTVSGITRQNNVVYSMTLQSGTLNISDGTDTVTDIISATARNNSNNITIFNLNQNGGMGTYYSKSRCYKFKMYDNDGNLVRDYVPGRLNRQYGLMDKVNDVFYTSPNGVAFSGG